MKILIIEDDQFLVTLLGTKLEKEGFDVSIAMDGEEGFDKAKEEKPQFILLDLILPKLNGFSVLEKIRKDSDLKQTPVVLLTNLGEKSDVEKGINLGADGYLVKADYTPDEIIQKIKEVAEKKGSK